MKSDVFKSTLLLLAAGLVPALVVLIFFDLQDNQLKVFGQLVARDYDATRLFAAILGIIKPALLFLPIALSSSQPFELRKNGALAVVGGLLVLGPALAACALVGHLDWRVGLTILGAVCWNITNLTAWCLCLGLVLARTRALILWAGLWAFSDFCVYLSQYVLPYLDLKLLQPLQFAHWLLPGFNGPLDGFNEYLISAGEAGSLNPAALWQLPILVGLWVFTSNAKHNSGAN